ncbi:hypothetical protein LRP31_25415 [Mesorhizobium mediterraneum]|uniref:Uncharacterized protein n=1 Tax=Mesorhizobium mediterraneum TaxID=43617 RepID=A0AB36R9G1_9HYPH|nr:hypothetical protein [Mesorhizobium mediterraneum]PAQ00898.1 hypothetical protein CIT25_17685 [Mesorhizobium mediterraneum]WIW52361.1 hypothetical protein LRP31_25415 [Mesorhizobium mediterraneum]
MQKSAVLDFVIASLIGAALLVLVGYFVEARELSFSFWLTHPVWLGAALWALVGVLIGSGLRYLAR